MVETQGLPGKRYTLGSTNIAGWKNGPGLKMYFLLKWGYSIAMLVYQRVPCFLFFPFWVFVVRVEGGFMDYRLRRDGGLQP